MALHHSHPALSGPAATGTATPPRQPRRADGIAASVLLLIGAGVATQRQESLPTELIADNAEKEPPPLNRFPAMLRKKTPPRVKVLDANLHYAAYTETKDTSDYQPPARVDEFVKKLATYHHINAVVLSDSATHSVAYVFPDN